MNGYVCSQQRIGPVARSLSVGMSSLIFGFIKQG